MEQILYESSSPKAPTFQRPYIIVDASFLLHDLLNNNNPRKFFSDCKYLSQIRKKMRIRIPREVYYEISTKVEPAEKETQIEEGMTLLKGLETTSLKMTSEEYQIFCLLIKEIRGAGKETARRLERNNLSRPDAHFCAYAVVKSRKGDVIAATRDKLIIDMLSFAFGIAHPIFLKQNCQDTGLFFAQDTYELKMLLAQAKTSPSLEELTKS